MRPGALERTGIRIAAQRAEGASETVGRGSWFRTGSPPGNVARSDCIAEVSFA